MKLAAKKFDIRIALKDREIDSLQELKQRIKIEYKTKQEAHKELNTQEHLNYFTVYLDEPAILLELPDSTVTVPAKAIIKASTIFLEHEYYSDLIPTLEATTEAQKGQITLLKDKGVIQDSVIHKQDSLIALLEQDKATLKGKLRRVKIGAAGVVLIVLFL